MGKCLDITEIKRRVEDPSLLAHFLWNETREGMAFVQSDGTMAAVNPAFARFLGYTVCEMEKMKFQDITIGQDTQPDMERFQKLLKGDVQEYEMVKSYTSKLRKTVTVRLRAVNYDFGVLVLGQVLPVDILSLDQMPELERKRITRMMIGELALENWKLVVFVFVMFGACLVAGIKEVPELLALFG